MLDDIPLRRYISAEGRSVSGATAFLTTPKIEASSMAGTEVTPDGVDSQHPEREIWKRIPSEPGVMASSLGRILQAPSYAPMANGGFRIHTPAPRVGLISKANKTATHEYRIVMLRRWGDGPRQQPRKVHQLVCEAFHGPKPFPNAVVIHIDENALNNRPENLRWGTQKENLNMPKFKEYCRGRTGENSPWTKGQAKRGIQP